MAKEIIENLGTILMLEKCPSCQKKASYHLIKKIYPAPKILRFLVKDNCLWHIECETCKNSVNVPVHEAEKVTEVKDIFAKASQNEIPPETVLETISKFSFVVDLLNQHASWVCPECKSKIDWRLQVCWNCSSPNPELKNQPQEVPPTTPSYIPPSCCG